MALDTRTVNISLRFPTNTASATVRFIPDLASGDAQVLLEKYYDAALTASPASTTVSGTIPLPVFTDVNKAINYRVQFPRESGVNEHYIALSKGNPNTAIDLSQLLTLAAVSPNQFALDDLTDVTITSPVSGEYLRYNGSQWVDSTIQAGDLPADVMLKSTYDTNTDGVIDRAEQVTVVCRNDDVSTMSIGTIVYISGANGNNVLIKRAQADDEMTSSKTFGMVMESIAAGVDGKVALNGTVKNVNTNGTPAGTALWLSPTVAGAFTATKPTQPDHSVFIGWVAREQTNNGRIELHIQNGYELEELHDVLLSSPVNGQVLTYDGVAGLWKNQAIAGLTIGNPISGGAADRVLFQDDSQNLATSADFTFDAITGELTVEDVMIGAANGGARFAHKDFYTNLSYALFQDEITGATFINGANNQHLYFRLNNSSTNQLTFDGTYWTIENNPGTSTRMSMSVTNTGVTSFETYGSAPSFYFNGSTEMEGNLVLTNNGYLLASTAIVGDEGGDAVFAYKSGATDYLTDTDYALRQDGFGNTFVNAVSGQNLHFRINNSTTNQLDFDGTYWTVSYDNTNKTSFSVTSTGVATFETYGSNPSFHFNGSAEMEGNLTLTNNGYLLASTAIVGDEGGDAVFAYKSGATDYLTDVDYAVRQDGFGNTFINAKVGQNLHFRINNSTTNQLDFDGTYWTISNTNTDKLSISVDSNGVSSFEAYGDAPSFYFNGAAEFEGTVTLTNNGDLLAMTAVVGDILGDAGFAFRGVDNMSNPVDNLTDTDYAIRQDYLGNTYINASSGEEIYLRVNNAAQNQWIVTATSLIGHYDNTHKVTFSVDASGYLDILTGNNNQAVNIARNGAMTLGSITEGAASVGSYTSAAKLDLTGLYGDWTPGDYRNNKIVLYRNNLTTAYYGLGISSGLLEVQSAGDIGFYAEEGVSAKTRRMLISKTGGVTVDGDLSVADEAYGAGWNGSLEVPTKNAVYDKIQTIGLRVTAGVNNSTTPTPDIDTTDLFTLTALSVAPTFGAPTGTPVNGQKLLIRIKDNGTARALNWDAAYVAGGASLPTTTVINKTMHLGFIYNTDNSLNKWMLIAKAEEA